MRSCPGERREDRRGIFGEVLAEEVEEGDVG